VKPAPFRYLRPGSLDEALGALEESGGEAKVLAGGQSLVPMLNMRLARPELLVDLNRVPGLDGIEAADGSVRVGALVRQGTMEASPLVRARVSLAAQALPYVGHFVTRNRGTVGGSIAHADGSAELPLALVALGGTVVTDRRDIAARDFFVTHYTTVLEPDEVVTATLWPGHGEPAAFEELALRAGDYALSMAAVCGSTVAVGAVTSSPTVLSEVGELLAGAVPLQDPSNNVLLGELAREAGALAARLVDPPGTVHAPAAYLKHLTGVLVERAVKRAWTSS
jgi:2-furoyl-CoA dehydrogenase FAD binding subunit